MAAYIQIEYESKQQLRKPTESIHQDCTNVCMYLQNSAVLTEHRAMSSISLKLCSEDWFEYNTLFDSSRVRRFNAEDNFRLSGRINPSKLDFFSSVSLFWGDELRGDAGPAASMSLSWDNSCS